MPNDERYDNLLFPGERLRFCARCDALIVEPIRAGRPRRYCDRCRLEVRRLRSRARPVERACRQCGRRFESRHGRRYCSDECRACAATARARADRARNGRSWDRVCEVCGGAFRAKASARYCKRRCKDAAERERARPELERRARERERDAVERRLERERRRELLRLFAGTGGQCAECGKWFYDDASVRQRRSRFCTRTCYSRAMSRNGKHRRRQRMRQGGSVSLAYIVERDGRRCHLCGKLVDMRAKVPHPSAPTLDHLVPLAAGGEHAPGNVALAHFACNVARRDVGPAQLIAFG